MTVILNRRQATVTSDHTQVKNKVKSQAVQKLEWKVKKKRDGQTDTTDRIILPCNAVANQECAARISYNRILFDKNMLSELVVNLKQMDTCTSRHEWHVCRMVRFYFYNVQK